MEWVITALTSCIPKSVCEYYNDNSRLEVHRSELDMEVIGEENTYLQHKGMGSMDKERSVSFRS